MAENRISIAAAVPCVLAKTNWRFGGAPFVMAVLERVAQALLATIRGHGFVGLALLTFAATGTAMGPSAILCIVDHTAVVVADLGLAIFQRLDVLPGRR